MLVKTEEGRQRACAGFKIVRKSVQVWSHMAGDTP